jgi:hypothetical protein
LEVVLANICGNLVGLDRSIGLVWSWSIGVGLNRSNIRSRGDNWSWGNIRSGCHNWSWSNIGSGCHNWGWSNIGSRGDNIGSIRSDGSSIGCRGGIWGTVGSGSFV